MRGRPKPRKKQVIGGLLVLTVLAVAWLLFGGRSLVKDIQWQVEENPASRQALTPLAFSADRKVLVRGGDPVRLYDAASGKLLLTLPTPNDSSSVNCVAFSPNGDVVACARHSDPYKEPSTIKAEFFNTKTGAKLADLDVATGSFAFSPDGTMLVTSSGKVEFWSVPGFKPIVAAPPLFGWAMAFSPDGKLLAIAQQTQVEIIDVKTLTAVAALPAPNAGYNNFRTVAFAADGKTVVAATHLQKSPANSAVYVWDLKTKQLNWHKEFGRSLTDASLSADGQTLAVKLSGYEFLSPMAWMEVWDLKRRSKIGSQKGSRHFRSMIALSEDGKRLAIELNARMPGDPSEIEIWKVE